MFHPDQLCLCERDHRCELQRPAMLLLQAASRPSPGVATPGAVALLPSPRLRECSPFVLSHQPWGRGEDLICHIQMKPGSVPIAVKRIESEPPPFPYPSLGWLPAQSQFPTRMKQWHHLAHAQGYLLRCPGSPLFASERDSLTHTGAVPAKKSVRSESHAKLPLVCSCE